MNIEGHEDYLKAWKKENTTPEDKEFLACAKFWANCMEAKRGNGHLTEEIIETAQMERLKKFPTLQFYSSEMLCFLSHVWKYGDELLNGQIGDSIADRTYNVVMPARDRAFRALTENKALRFLHDPATVEKSNAEILATVLPTHELLDDLNDVPEADIKKFLPMLCINFNQSYSGWKADLKEDCKRAKKMLTAKGIYSLKKRSNNRF